MHGFVTRAATSLLLTVSVLAALCSFTAFFVTMPAWAALSDQIGVDFVPGDSPQCTGTPTTCTCDHPLEKAIRHVFTLTNNGASSVGISVDTDPESDIETDYHATVFPQPTWMTLAAGETRKVVAILEKRTIDPVDPGNTATYEKPLKYSIHEIGSDPNDPNNSFFTNDVTYRFVVHNANDMTGNLEIQGVVTDESGNAIEGAGVQAATLYSSDNFSRSATTGADGTFSLANLPDGRKWSVLITAGVAYDAVAKFVLNDLSGNLGSIALTPKPATTLSYTLQETLTGQIGFWKQAVSADGEHILLSQGMENWPGGEGAPQKSDAKLMLYNMDGTLVWEHAMGWQSWGADLYGSIGDGEIAYALYVQEATDPNTAQNYPHLVLLDGNTGDQQWSRNLTGDPQYEDRFPAPANYPGGMIDHYSSKEVTFSHNGDSIAMGTVEGPIFLLNRTDGSVIWSYFYDYGQVRRCIFDANDAYLYVGSGAGFLYKLSVANGTPAVNWETPKYIESWPYTYGLALSPDGTKIAAGTKSGALYVYNTNDGTLAWNVYMGIMTVRWVQFSPDGAHLIAGSGAPGGTMVYDADDGTPVWQTLKSAVGMYTHDGSHVFIGDWSARFLAPSDGNLEKEYNPGINTSYWKVGYINDSMTRFAVGARDMATSGVSLAFFEGSPTLAYLVDFRAAPSGDSIRVTWKTTVEIDVAGFYLQRSESEGGAYERIALKMIPAQGSGSSGAAYAFVDADVRIGQTYWYKLVEIGLDGGSTLHGPVSAEVTAGPADWRAARVDASTVPSQPGASSHAVQINFLFVLLAPFLTVVVSLLRVPRKRRDGPGGHEEVRT